MEGAAYGQKEVGSVAWGKKSWAAACVACVYAVTGCACSRPAGEKNLSEFQKWSLTG
jgi:hypothetical protein